MDGQMRTRTHRTKGEGKENRCLGLAAWPEAARVLALPPTCCNPGPQFPHLKSEGIVLDAPSADNLFPVLLQQSWEAGVNSPTETTASLH